MNTDNPNDALRELIKVHGFEHIHWLVVQIGEELEPTAAIRWTTDSRDECWRGEPGGYVIERFKHADGAEYEVSVVSEDSSTYLGEAESLYEAKFLAAQVA